jgi:hypothetical protein
MHFLKFHSYFTNVVALILGAAVVVAVEDTTNPVVVVVVDGIENVEVFGVLVIIGNAVVVIGWASRLESALFADELAGVVVGRKLVELGAGVVVVPAGVLNEKEGPNEAPGIVVAVVVVVAGVENEKPVADVVDAAVVAAGVPNENDGIA